MNNKLTMAEQYKKINEAERILYDLKTSLILSGDSDLDNWDVQSDKGPPFKFADGSVLSAEEF